MSSAARKPAPAPAMPLDPIAWEETLPIRPSSPAWRAVIKAAYGSPLAPDEHALFLELSGGVDPPEGGTVDLMCTVGRRGGKSETISRVAMFECLHGGHEVALAPGQLGLFAVVSPLREQSEQIIGYAKGLAALSSVKRHVAKVLADETHFKNGIVLRTMTCDAVAVSGPTLIGAVYDEWAKWPGEESATPDYEVDASLRPALAPVIGAPPRRHIRITSAYLQEGDAYDTERASFGVAGAPVLVVRGNTETFNPAIDRAWLERERARNPHVYEREYGGTNGPQWQPAVTKGWFGLEVVTACVDKDRTESPRIAGVHYTLAIDQAFKADRFAIAVTHAEYPEAEPRSIGGPGAAPRYIIDLAKAWRAPKDHALSVEQAACDVAAICERYGNHAVYCDQFAAEPLKVVFKRYGVQLIERPWTASTKPIKYRAVRDAMVDKSVRLPNHPELIREFCNIQGRLLRSGGESIEAHRGGDDLVSATVLAISETQVSVRDPNDPGVATYAGTNRTSRSAGRRRLSPWLTGAERMRRFMSD